MSRDRFQPAAGDGWRTSLVQSRVLVAVLLIAGGVVWAIARGMTFYGLTPTGLYDGIAQPPLLTVLVGAWLMGRSRRR